jgi:hypothetical protein
MQVKDLTTDELKELIKEPVAEALQELLPDPDAGKNSKQKSNTSCSTFSSAEPAEHETFQPQK